MRTWLPLVALCAVAYLLGSTVKAAWGGLLFLSYAAISLGLWCFCLTLCALAKDSASRALCICVALIESLAVMVMLSAWFDYHSWGGGMLTWYYSNWAWALDWLAVVEAALLILFIPARWVYHGGITRLYRSILAYIAGFMLAGYRGGIIVPCGVWAQVQGVRGEALQ